MRDEHLVQPARECLKRAWSECLEVGGAGEYLSAALLRHVRQHQGRLVRRELADEDGRRLWKLGVEAAGNHVRLHVGHLAEAVQTVSIGEEELIAAAVAERLGQQFGGHINAPETLGLQARNGELVEDGTVFLRVHGIQMGDFVGDSPDGAFVQPGANGGRKFGPQRSDDDRYLAQSPPVNDELIGHACHPSCARRRRVPVRTLCNW